MRKWLSTPKASAQTQRKSISFNTPKANSILALNPAQRNYEMQSYQSFNKTMSQISSPNVVNTKQLGKINVSLQKLHLFLKKNDRL